MEIIAIISAVAATLVLGLALGLEHENQVEVRYILDKNTGEAIVVTPVFCDRLREFAVGAVFGTIWAGVLICLKMNGMLD